MLHHGLDFLLFIYIFFKICQFHASNFSYTSKIPFNNLRRHTFFEYIAIPYHDFFQTTCHDFGFVYYLGAQRELELLGTRFDYARGSASRYSKDQRSLTIGNFFKLLGEFYFFFLPNDDEDR